MSTPAPAPDHPGPVFDVHLHGLPAAVMHLAVSNQSTRDPELFPIGDDRTGGAYVSGSGLRSGNGR